MKFAITILSLIIAAAGCDGAFQAGPAAPAPQAPPAAVAPDAAAQPAAAPVLVPAEVGVGAKGRGYGGGIISEPIRAKFRAEQMIVFDIQIPKAMQLFDAINERAPASHDEFMEAIIKANQIVLPDLPVGETYLYVPESKQLMVQRPGS